MERMTSLLGIFVFLSIAYFFSENRKKIRLQQVAIGLTFQLTLAFIVLWTSPGRDFFQLLNNAITHLIQFSNSGAEMVFGEKYKDHFFAFSVLPSIIFLSSLMAVLFHWGVMQRIVGSFSFIMRKTLKTSGAESLAASANVFVGGLEACFCIRPYLENLTRSELMAISTAGLSTIAGGVLAAYVGLGFDAGHLLAAQLISSVGSLIVAKIIIPETNKLQTMGNISHSPIKDDVNTIDAACRGAMDGIRVAAAVAAVLIAFVALTSMINYFLSLLPLVFDQPLSVERVLGWLFTPVVFLTGAEWKDCQQLGTLLGKKIFLNEFLAFLDLKTMRDTLSPRSTVLATYFLCGFANFAALAMHIGGLGALIPTRKKEIAGMGMRFLLGGTLTSLISACIAGLVWRG